LFGGPQSLPVQAQLILDAGRTDNWASLSKGGLPKLMLGLLAMSFDAVFCVQHYILYRGSGDRDEAHADEGDAQPPRPTERDRLLDAA
jgi:cystinosin